jgi:hypothetical protein
LSRLDSSEEKWVPDGEWSLWNGVAGVFLVVGSFEAGKKPAEGCSGLFPPVRFLGDTRVGFLLLFGVLVYVSLAHSSRHYCFL